MCSFGKMGIGSRETVTGVFFLLAACACAANGPQSHDISLQTGDDTQAKTAWEGVGSNTGDAQSQPKDRSVTSGQRTGLGQLDGSIG